MGGEQPTRRGDGGPVPGRLLIWSAVVLAAAVLATAVSSGQSPTVGDRTVGDVVRVGVGDGGSIPGYLRASRDRLTALLAGPAPTGHPDGPYALVSFASYLRPDQLPAVLAGASVAEVIGRVPLSDTQTQIVRIPAARIPADVIAGMRQVAERKDREAREYRERAAGLAGGDEQLRRIYDSQSRVAAAEAEAYRSHCGCLYAAVVRAAPAVLGQIATRPQVRAVDPAPEVRRVDRAVFLPPLPEQADVVRPPVDKSLPAVEGVADTDVGVGMPGVAT